MNCQPSVSASLLCFRVDCCNKYTVAYVRCHFIVYLGSDMIIVACMSLTFHYSSILAIILQSFLTLFQFLLDISELIYTK